MQRRCSIVGVIGWVRGCCGTSEARVSLFSFLSLQSVPVTRPASSLLCRRDLLP